MGVRLVLTLTLDSDPGVHTPEQVRAYAEQVADSVLAAARRGSDAAIEWHAHQLVDVVVEVDPA